MLSSSIRSVASPAFAHNLSRMAESLRQKDWRNSPLGGIETWSPSLTTVVGLVLDSVSAKFLLWGPDQICFYNDAFLPFLDGNPVRGIGSNPFKVPLPPESGIGQSYPEFRPDMWLRLRPRYLAARGGVPQTMTEFRTIIHPNGVREAVHFTLSILPVWGEDREIAGVLIDTVETTTKATIRDNLFAENRRLHELFDHAPVFISLLSVPGFRIETANKASIALSGDREIIGRTAAEVFPEVENQGFLRLLTQVSESGLPVTARDAAIDLQRTNDGPIERCYIDYIFQPIIDPAGDVTAILIVGSDVTEHHRSKKQSDRLQAQLLDVSRRSAMAVMAETIAHELSQPLMAAGAYMAAGLRLLADSAISPKTAPSPEAVGAFQGAREQIERIGTIVRGARRIVQGSTADRENVRLGSIVIETLKLCASAGYPDEMVIDNRIGSEGPMVFANPVQIEQILINLIRNAAEAMRGCDRRILTISSRRQEDKLVEILIHDTGRGFPEHGPASPLTPDPSKIGLGVGLALSRQIVEANGGILWARNNEDVGATIGFTLPLAGPAPEPSSDPEAGTRSTESTHP